MRSPAPFVLLSVVAAAHPTWFRTMAVWASPTGDQWAAMTAGATAQKALREGHASEHWTGWKTITTKRAFYESFRGVDVDRSLAEYPGAFLSVRGSLDHLTANEAEVLNLAPGRPKETAIIGGASHIFNVLNARGVISVAERQAYIGRVRDLAKGSCAAWMQVNGWAE